MKILLLAIFSVCTTALDLSKATVADTQQLLRSWGMHESFGTAFRALKYDGRALSVLSVSDFNKATYPDATSVQWKVLLQEVAQHSVEHLEVERQARRLQKQVNTKNFIGVRVKEENSLIALGKNQDVSFVRTGPKELSLYADKFKLKSISSSKIFLGGKDLNGVITDKNKPLAARLKKVEDVLKKLGGKSLDQYVKAQVEKSKLKTDFEAQKTQSRHAHAMAMCMGSGGIGEYRSIITISWHKSTGKNVNDACHKKINAGWHACGVVKDNYHGQACASNFGGSIRKGAVKAAGTFGGYQSFITRDQIAKSKWHASGTCDEDSVWICCSPQCSSANGKVSNPAVSTLVNSQNAIKAMIAKNERKDNTAHVMAMCMGAASKSRSYQSIITITWHVNVGKGINNACHKSINGGWHACGVVKDNYIGQSCAKDFGGSLHTGAIGKNGKQYGGYQSFITRSQVEKSTWHAKGSCDHDAVWICCSPQC